MLFFLTQVSMGFPPTLPETIMDMDSYNCRFLDGAHI